MIQLTNFECKINGYNKTHFYFNLILNDSKVFTQNTYITLYFSVCNTYRTEYFIQNTTYNFSKFQSIVAISLCNHSQIVGLSTFKNFSTSATSIDLLRNYSKNECEKNELLF
ncbi:hypothetical protein BpHYR1_032183 [Brachionus plicatilis]|uniref:Uncharacterized protein n=1 Tax=Brachionus plicatilis TaxID=10195 RepID=A0A3M7QQP3_BRAPC|nr:hypothetical protein BpHYR1_032183 [Brachionus plicatilis]